MYKSSLPTIDQRDDPLNSISLQFLTIMGFQPHAYLTHEVHVNRNSSLPTDFEKEITVLTPSTLTSVSILVSLSQRSVGSKDEMSMPKSPRKPIINDKIIFKSP